MNGTTNSYRMFLKQRIAESQKAHPMFSERAFAKKLGVASGFLSEVLSGKKNLSPEMALRFTSRLEMSARESGFFCMLVQLESTRDPELQALIIQKLKQELGAASGLGIEVPTDLSLEAFTAIADWYHIAIRNLVELDDFECTPKNVAKRLGITVIEAEVAIDRLLKLELIEKSTETTSGYLRRNPHLRIQSPAPNRALRKFHECK